MTEPGDLSLKIRRGVANALLVLFICFLLFIVYARVTGYFEDRDRVRPSEVLSDMRSMETAVETYYMDHNAYPPSGSGVVALTTPVSYLTWIPSDPFLSAKEDEDIPLSYFTNEKEYLLYSAGPDGKINLYPEADLAAGMPTLMGKSFDATNGTKSSGDLWRKGSREQNQ